MEKPIFSISCTTCQTRLAVRSEAVIGQILECPKCRSMVYIVPPPSWMPTTAPSPESHAAGPPPLDRVAAGPATLSLELPTETSLLDAVFDRMWLVWIIALAIALLVVGTMLWLLLPATEPKPTAVEPERPAATVVETPADKQRPDKPKSAEPKPKSDDVVPPKSATQPAVPPMLPETKPKTKPKTPVVVEKKETPKDAAKEKEAEKGKNDAKEKTKEKKEADVEQKPEQPEVKKLPATQVDVAARMADPLPGLDLTDIPLTRAFDLLSRISTVPVTLDPDAMRQLGVTAHDGISLKLDSTTIGQAFQAIAAERGLAVTIDNGQAIVAAPADSRETSKTVRYTVSDLTGDDKAAVTEFATLVKTLVAPESWQEVNGRGTIKLDPGTLVVSQTGDAHQQILAFCEKLRNARQKPLRSRDKPEQFTLTTRTSQARKMLDKPVTVNFHEPTPLVRILNFLAETTGSDILIDRAALSRAETSDGVETSLTAQKQPFAAALTDLLRPLGLTYRIVAANAIQVTTIEAAEERLEVEFYSIGSIASSRPSGAEPKKTSPRPLREGAGVRAAKFIASLKSEISPSTWSDAGGSGVIYFDAPSQFLIVLQSQPTQAAIERLLTARPHDDKKD